MTGPFELPVDAYLQGPWLVIALAGLGFGIGVLTGVFGVGGGFLVVPFMMVVYGLDESMATGSSLSFIIGTSAAGFRRQLRLRSVELKTTLILAGGGVCGAKIGAMIHMALRAGLGEPGFPRTMRVLYLVVLGATALLVWKGPSDREDDLSLLQRVPGKPRVSLPDAGLTDISLFGLCFVGVFVGIFTGLMGVGGGVLFMPILLLVVGLGPHQAVGTSLGVVLFSASGGAVSHASAGNVNLWIAMSLLVGSSIGVQVGTWVCHKLQATRLRQYFVLVVLAAIVIVAADLVHSLLR